MCTDVFTIITAMDQSGGIYNGTGGQEVNKPQAMPSLFTAINPGTVVNYNIWSGTPLCEHHRDHHCLSGI